MSRRRALVIGAVIVVLTLVGLGLANQESLVPFALATGVLGSVVANIVWALLNSKEMGGESELFRRLERITDGLDQQKGAGIVAVHQKFDDKPQYWSTIADSTRNQFLMIGYALSTAFGPEMKAGTTAALERVLRAGGEACFVLIDPRGPATHRLTQVRGVNFGPAIEETIATIRDLHSRLPSAARARLEVRLLPPEETPPYWALITDATVEFAPYLLRESTSRAFHISFEAKSSFARLIISDFMRVRNASYRVDLG